MAHAGEFSDAVSEDSGFEESTSPNDRKNERRLQNEKYDMALELSASASMDGDEPGGDRKTAEEEKEGRGSFGKIVSDDKPKAGEDVKNDQFDAAYDLSSADDDSSMDTREAAELVATKKRTMGAPAASADRRPSDTGASASKTPAGTTSLVPNLSTSGMRAGTGVDSGANSDASESGSESSSNEDEGSDSHKLEGVYNAEDYAHLKVSAEIKDLFQYIGRYKTHEVDLDTSLRCFVPDFIPSVGDTDAFLKVPRPDNKPDELGFKMLDEPSAGQSDATVLELQLRAISKKQHGDVAVRSIENAHKNPADIDKWIQSIDDLHRSRPPPQVHYKKSMPDIEVLMEAWPPEFEAILGNVNILNQELDLSLEEYARMICAVMDIPVYDNLIESLHVLFTTFMEFKSNAHFMQLGGAGGPGLVGVAGDLSGPPDCNREFSYK